MGDGEGKGSGEERDGGEGWRRVGRVKKEGEALLPEGHFWVAYYAIVWFSMFERFVRII